MAMATALQRSASKASRPPWSSEVEYSAVSRLMPQRRVLVWRTRFSVEAFVGDVAKRRRVATIPRLENERMDRPRDVSMREGMTRDSWGLKHSVWRGCCRQLILSSIPTICRHGMDCSARVPKGSFAPEAYA